LNNNYNNIIIILFFFRYIERGEEKKREGNIKNSISCEYNRFLLESMSKTIRILRRTV